MIRFLFLFASVLLSSTFGSEACARSLSGRLTTSGFAFEHSREDSSSQRHLRVYQAVQVRVHGLGRPELLLVASGRFSSELQADSAGERQARLSHAYLRWEAKDEVFTVRVGRQFVFAGAAVGQMDGVRSEVRLPLSTRIDVFAGRLPTPEPRNGGGPSDGYLLGAHLSGRDVLGARLGLSVFRRSRQLAPYMSEARLDSGIPVLEISPGEVEQQMVGLDLSRQAGRWNLYGRWDLSTPGGWTTRRAEAVLRYHRDRWTFSGEGLYRTPYIDANSIFAVFVQSANREYAARANYRFDHRFSGYAHLVAVDFEGDRAFRLNLGLRAFSGTLGYSGRRGYGGDSDGLSASLRHRLSSQLRVDGSLNLSRFRTQSTGARSLASSQTLTVNYRPHPKVSLALQGQNLNQHLELATRANPFRGNAHDLRIFLSATTWFFHGGGPGS